MEKYQDHIEQNERGLARAKKNGNEAMAAKKTAYIEFFKKWAKKDGDWPDEMKKEYDAMVDPTVKAMKANDLR